MQVKVNFKKGKTTNENVNILGFNLKDRKPIRLLNVRLPHWHFTKLKSAMRKAAAPSRAFQTSVKPMTHFMRRAVKETLCLRFHGGISVRKHELCIRGACYPVSQRQMLFLIKSLISIVMLGLWPTLGQDQPTRVENRTDLWAQSLSYFSLPEQQPLKNQDEYVRYKAQLYKKSTMSSYLHSVKYTSGESDIHIKTISPFASSWHLPCASDVPEWQRQDCGYN